ncbi:ATP-grasp domain-containing protein, partial [bacterium]|nr:ATP-grasp domain-containing protein [bacterium]
MQKLKVGVLMGGKSLEREVSFNSGRTICDHLDTQLYDIIPLFQTEDNRLFILPWRFLHRGKIADFLQRLENEAVKTSWDELKKTIDFMYIAVHGRYAEDGTLQGFLEVLGIPYLGTKVFGSALGMDKSQQKKWLIAHGIIVPNGIEVTPTEFQYYCHPESYCHSEVTKNPGIANKNSSVIHTSHKATNSRPEQPVLRRSKSVVEWDPGLVKNNPNLWQRLEEKKLKFPLIVKPNSEGSSLGISIVFKKEELIPALEKAIFVFKASPQTALIEEKIEGMEFTHITVFDKEGNALLLPPTEVVHEEGKHFHDYEQKYMPGRSIKFTPARCSLDLQQKIHEECVKTAKVLEFKTISRIDGFVKKDGTIVIVDPNSLSGMAPSGFVFNQAACIGMSHTDFINHLIETELHAYALLTNNKKFDMGIKKQALVQETKKMRVAVLFGGDTHEKEVSLESGRNVCYKLARHSYDVLPLFVDAQFELYPLTKKLLVHNATAEIEHELDRSTKIAWADLPALTDFVFIALHGGRGENGSVQGALEMLGLPYNGSGIAASALCMDKHKTNNFLRDQGFDVPLNALISKEDWLCSQEALMHDLLQKLHFPLIIKPHNDGCSTGVSRCLNKEELKT